MKMHYYPETDSLYVEFKSEPSVETTEILDGLNADLDARGGVVGFDIDHAAERIELRTAWSSQRLTSRGGAGEDRPGPGTVP